MVERANRVAAAAALGQQRRQGSAEPRKREQGPPALRGGDAPPSPRQQPAAQQPPAEDEQANDADIGSAEQPISDSEADLTDADEDKVRMASDEVCPEDDEALRGAAAGSAVPFSAEQMPGLVTLTPVSGTCWLRQPCMFFAQLQSYLHLVWLRGLGSLENHALCTHNILSRTTKLGSAWLKRMKSGSASLQL